MGMRRTARWAMFLLAAAGAASACVAGESKSDKEAVEAAAAQFYTALNTMFTGDLGPMKKVWSHAADVTYMGPGGGMQVGWDQVLPVWETQAALKLGGSVRAEQTHVIIEGAIAVVQNYEKGENGEGREVSIRATNLFRTENGKWKLIGHHTDLLPFLNQ